MLLSLTNTQNHHRIQTRNAKKQWTKITRTNQRKNSQYDIDPQKSVIRRFRTIYHQLDQFDNNTQKFLKNLNKKFDNKWILQKPTNTQKQHQRILQKTLPSPIKRICRTNEGLMRCIRLQKIRWMKKNVLFNAQNLQNDISNQKKSMLHHDN